MRNSASRNSAWRNSVWRNSAWRCCALAVALTMTLPWVELASAQTNPLPRGNVTVVVPFPAGGPLDALARILIEKLSPRIGRTMIVENKAGAGGNIGTASVAKAEPDGLTWLLDLDTVFTVNPHLYASQGFDPNKDLVPVSLAGDFVLMLAVNPKVPAKSLSELVSYSKTKPLTFASAGVGSPGHLAFEYLKSATKMDGVHVPFRGAGPALTEMVAGHVDAGFVTSSILLDHVRAGNLRPLAVSGRERLPAAPDVPTVAETGYREFDARFAFLVMLPAKTPDAIRQYVASAVVEAYKLPDVRERLSAMAIQPTTSSESEAGAWITKERERWRNVIVEAGIKGN